VLPNFVDFLICETFAGEQYQADLGDISPYLRAAEDIAPGLMHLLRGATAMITSIVGQRKVTPSDLAQEDLSDIPSEALVDDLKEHKAHLLKADLPEGFNAIESLYHTAKDKQKVSDGTARGEKCILRDAHTRSIRFQSCADQQQGSSKQAGGLTVGSTGQNDLVRQDLPRMEGPRSRPAHV
jgi:hypothetical protein